jgi:hypothetical protein
MDSVTAYTPNNEKQDFALIKKMSGTGKGVRAFSKYFLYEEP